jgi:uncharacterized protein (TIGR03083 family)
MEYVVPFRAEVARLAALLGEADLATPVPSCPGWNLARLARHVGVTHRWVEAIVRTGALARVDPRSFRDTAPADDDALPGWLDAGAGELAAIFEATPPDRPTWTWSIDRHAGWWPRRMLHEAAVHHADAAVALGRPVEVGAALAADGVEEFLANLPHAAWVDAVGRLAGTGEAIAFVATDTGASWLVTLEAAAVGWSPGRGPADVTVAAPIGELYLFLYGRLPAREVTGDSALLDRWRASTQL